MPHTASELDNLIAQFKSAAAPNKAAIEAFRSQIDAAFDAEAITIKQWRELVEKYSHIRRSPRV